MRRIDFLAGLFLLAAGCGGGEKPSTTAQDKPARALTTIELATEAARVANAIEALPTRADSILKAAGQTPESFQQMMYQIAADSAMSAAYAAARVE